jgi:ATP adenylyltransferase
MERLYAPWRAEYLTARESPGCVFCAALEQSGEPGSLVVTAAALNFVVMNLYPYTSGHLMVAPRRHVGSLAQATPEELAEMMELARRLEQVLQDAYRPEGVNLGMNLGKAAGAGIRDHIHLHLVPRWTGDANFMTVVGETRVMPEEPAAACLRLRQYFSR